MLRGVSFYRKDPPEGFVTYLDYEGGPPSPEKSPKKFMLLYFRYYTEPLKSSPFHHLQSQLGS